MKFTKALRYAVEVTCLSPLRTGSADGGTEAILRRWDGTPILQGASLTGALRDWQDNRSLFGSPTGEGSLIVSDVEFSQLETMTRPRVRISGKTGAAETGGKFDVSALPAGTQGSFTLVWRGVDGQACAAGAIEEYLSALHSGEICLGGQKSNGFGRVALRVKRRRYDLTAEADREAWLSGEQPTEVIALKAAGGKRVTFRVSAVTPAILVKSSVGTGNGEDGVDAVQYRENDTLLVPGSSIKGAVRGQITRFAPFFGAEDQVEALFGRASESGDNGIAGRIRFSDGTFQQPQESGKIVRIRINRFTGGVMRKAMFSEKNVGGTLCWEISVPAGQKLGCGLVLYALRDLGLGLYNLGSEGSIGHGRLDELKVEIRSPEGMGTLRCANGAVTIDDPNGIIAGWQAALGGAEK